MTCLTGNQHSLTYMLMSHFPFLMMHSQISCQILFQTNNYLRWSRPSLDEPPYKNLILYKDNFHKTFIHGKNNMFHLLTFNNLQNHLNQFIQESKQNYLNKVAEKLSDPSTSTKCDWSLLKLLLNDKKISCITPIFHNNKYMLDFKGKNEFFNSFFAEQCLSYLTKVYHRQHWIY